MGIFFCFHVGKCYFCQVFLLIVRRMTQLFLSTLRQHLIDFDTSFFLTVNSYHNSFWDVFMPLYSGRYEWIFLYVSIFYVIARNYSWKHSLLMLLSAILVIIICDQVTSSLIRPFVGRLRPANLENPISDSVHVVDGRRGGSYSFPSAHAANSWGLAIYVCLIFRKKWISLCLMFWAAFNCYTRLYMGMHYFGDLLAGMLIGCFGAVLVYYLIVHPFIRNDQPKHIRDSYVPIVVFLLTIAVFLVISTVETLSS